MFGSKNDNPQTEHIRDIRRRARAMQQGQPLAGAQEAGGGQRALRFFIVLFPVLTAALAAQGLRPALQNMPLHIPGAGELNDLLFSAHPPAVTGSAAGDLVIASAAKALAICALAAVLPLCAVLWTRLRDNARGSPYITFWGTTVGIPFLWFFLKDFLGPLLVDVFDVIS